MDHVEDKLKEHENKIKEHEGTLEEYKDIAYILKDMTQGMIAQKENIDKLAEVVNTTTKTVDYIKSKQNEMETKQKYQPYIWIENIIKSNIFKKIIVFVAATISFVLGYILK